jgi:hypothetical protein
MQLDETMLHLSFSSLIPLVGQEATTAAFQEHPTSIFSSLYLPPYDASVVTRNEFDSYVNFRSHVVLKPKFTASIHFSLFFWYGTSDLFTTQDQEKSCPVQNYSSLTNAFTLLFNIVACICFKPLLRCFYNKTDKYYNIIGFKKIIEMRKFTVMFQAK